MNVVVLEVAWGPWDVGRWFKINPHNFTGRRLHEFFGKHPFVVTNACPETVDDARGRGKPSKVWLRENLRRLEPKFVLVCGGVAQRTFERDMVSESCQLMMINHPAARTWTKSALLATEIVVQLRLDGIAREQNAEH